MISRRQCVLGQVLLAGVAVWGVAAALGAQPSTHIVTLVRDLRIGADDGSDGELRGFVRVAPAPDGSVYAYAGCRISHYDARGRFLGLVGRCGDGPGEFRGVAAMGFLKDTVWVADERHQRVTLLLPDGRVTRTIPIRYDPRDPNLTPDPPRAMLLGGDAVAEGSLKWQAGAPVRSPLVRMRRDGSVIDTVATLLEKSASDMSLRQGDRLLGVYRQPFNRRAFWAVRADGGGVAIVDATAEPKGDAGAILVSVIDAAGKRAASRSYPYRPTPLSSRVADSTIESIATMATGSDTKPVDKSVKDAVASDVRKAIVLPKYLPAVSQVLFGKDGSLWLRREDLGGGSWFTVFDGTGAEVGLAKAPAGFVAYADLANVFVVETDADGIPFIVRMTVRR